MLDIEDAFSRVFLGGENVTIWNGGQFFTI
jgi:hypothetical protein